MEFAKQKERKSPFHGPNGLTKDIDYLYSELSAKYWQQENQNFLFSQQLGRDHEERRYQKTLNYQLHSDHERRMEELIKEFRAQHGDEMRRNKWAKAAARKSES